MINKSEILEVVYHLQRYYVYSIVYGFFRLNEENLSVLGEDVFDVWIVMGGIIFFVYTIFLLSRLSYKGKEKYSLTIGLLLVTVLLFELFLME